MSVLIICQLCQPMLCSICNHSGIETEEAATIWDMSFSWHREKNNDRKLHGLLKSLFDNDINFAYMPLVISNSMANLDVTWIENVIFLLRCTIQVIWQWVRIIFLLEEVHQIIGNNNTMHQKNLVWHSLLHVLYLGQFQPINNTSFIQRFSNIHLLIYYYMPKYTKFLGYCGKQTNNNF